MVKRVAKSQGQRYVRRGMTVRAFAEWLGVEVQVVRRLIRGGLLQVHRISPRKTIVTAAEINRFLADTRVLHER